MHAGSRELPSLVLICSGFLLLQVGGPSTLP